jgi:mannose-6-phosphate isomerase
MTSIAIPAVPEVLTDKRPWGQFERLVLNETVTVKVITVSPGSRLSLQRHIARDEWWTVLDRGLTVEVAGLSWEPAIGERVWIPRGANHRAGNAGPEAARFLEVAFGTFDEADIERIADDYHR